MPLNPSGKWSSGWGLLKFLTGRGFDLALNKEVLQFIKIAPENPVLWTGMKDASAEGREKQTRCWNKFSMTR